MNVMAPAIPQKREGYLAAKRNRLRPVLFYRNEMYAWCDEWMHLTGGGSSGWFVCLRKWEASRKSWTKTGNSDQESEE